MENMHTDVRVERVKLHRGVLLWVDVIYTTLL